jgi:hypothetical protein
MKSRIGVLVATAMVLSAASTVTQAAGVQTTPPAFDLQLTAVNTP